MPRRSLLLIALILALTVAGGCGATAPVKLTEAPGASQLRSSHERPLRYSVAFAPVVDEFAVRRTRKPEGEHGAVVKADTGALRAEIAQALRDFEVFEELQTIDASDEALALELARNEGADLLLTASLVRYNVAYDHGTRGGGTVIVWLFSPWLSWLVGDEVYSADIGILMTLKRTTNSSILWQKLIDGKASRELDDIQRGLKTHEYFIGSILTGAGSFDESNYQKAAAVVGPHAMQDLQLKLIDEMYKIPQPPPEKKSFAIVVGVNKSGVPLLPKLKYAQADATGFADLLKNSASDYSEVKLLTGEVATLKDLRGAVEEFSAREHIEIIDFMVYFAGPGASVGGKHYLAFPDSTDANSMLTLEELHSLVEGVQAKNRVIVLDTGFAGEGSRGLVLSGPAIQVFPKALTENASVATVSSCGASQGGHEFEKLGHGVFTSQLIKALAGPADIDADKAVSAEELVTFLEWPVERYVRDNTIGQLQKPALACTEKAAGTVIVRIK